MKKSDLKKFAQQRLPLLYKAVHFVYVRIYGQILSEVRVVKQLGFRQVVKELFGGREIWKEELPIQKVLRYTVSEDTTLPNASLKECLVHSNISFKSGGHSLYLNPDSIQNSPFSFLHQLYPADSGLKIVSNPGDIDESIYISEKSRHSELQRKISYHHKQLTLVANFLNLNVLGPRLYDLVELEWQDRVWTAYVIEHVDGVEASGDSCNKGIQKLKTLQAQGLISITCPKGFQNMDFKCPGCNGNALLSKTDNSFSYVDFQNFLLPGYEKFLIDTSKKAMEATHFGEKSLLRGGKYLYQSIPGVKLPAKRRVESRFDIFEKLLEELNLSLEHKVVLDIGCNIGMMMAEYLKHGAAWCHGWDLETTTPHTKKLLLTIGATRFSLTGKKISLEEDLKADLPTFLQNNLSGCVISYLAVRRHLGWLKDLAKIPWSFLLYEGHEGESEEDYLKFIEEFQKLVPISASKMITTSDGECLPRQMAILVR